MKPAILYHGQLDSAFAARQDWGKYSLAIVAGKDPVNLEDYRRNGLAVLSYTHPGDTELVRKVREYHNDGVFFDLAARTDVDVLDGIAAECARIGKVFAVNSGWGSNHREDYGRAQLVMVESFVGTFEEGTDPAMYMQRDWYVDMTKVRRFKELGYQVVALSYGRPNGYAFCGACFKIAKKAGADYFIYTQSPAWEKPGAGFRFWRDEKFYRILPNFS